jgi:hypothetical protein
MARTPDASDIVSKQQRVAAEALERIAEWSDTFALPAATRRIVERIAQGQQVDPDDATPALQRLMRCGQIWAGISRRAPDGVGQELV